MKSLDGPSGPEHDFTDLHAWCEVYVPAPAGSGWTPLPDCLPARVHIPLACTPIGLRGADHRRLSRGEDKFRFEFENRSSGYTKTHG